MAKSHMTPDMLEYLVAACDETQGDLEKQVDAAVLRRKLKFSPEEDLNAQRGLQYRGYITTKGAGEGNVGFFWVTEEGVQAAIREGELTGNARFLREFWNNSSSQEVFEGILAWRLCREFGEIDDLGRNPLESKALYQILTAEGWEIPAGTMDQIFKDWEEEGLIATSTIDDTNEVATHGGRKIWSVDEDRLRD